MPCDIIALILQRIPWEYSSLLVHHVDIKLFSVQASGVLRRNPGSVEPSSEALLCSALPTHCTQRYACHLVLMRWAGYG